MAFTQEQIELVAKLARLHLNPEEIQMYSDQLGDILDYFDKLNEVDVSHLEGERPFYSHELPLREDVVQGQETSREDLLNCSPQEIIGDQIALKNIMNK